jgi:hypothetical protein
MAAAQTIPARTAEGEEVSRVLQKHEDTVVALTATIAQESAARRADVSLINARLEKAVMLDDTDQIPLAQHPEILKVYTSIAHFTNLMENMHRMMTEAREAGIQFPVTPTSQPGNRGPPSSQHPDNPPFPTPQSPVQEMHRGTQITIPTPPGPENPSPNVQPRARPLTPVPREGGQE